MEVLLSARTLVPRLSGGNAGALLKPQAQKYVDQHVYSNRPGPNPSYYRSQHSTGVAVYESLTRFGPFALVSLFLVQVQYVTSTMASMICFTFTHNWKVSVCESQASFGSGSDWISQGAFRRRPLFVRLRQIPLRDESHRYVNVSR
jgi:hypothetical protein